MLVAGRWALRSVRASNGATTQASIAMGIAAAAHTFITVPRVQVGIWTVRSGGVICRHVRVLNW